MASALRQIGWRVVRSNVVARQLTDGLGSTRLEATGGDLVVRHANVYVTGASCDLFLLLINYPTTTNERSVRQKHETDCCRDTHLTTYNQC